MDCRGKWPQHILRKNNTRVRKLVYEYVPDGRRNVGWPRKRWRDQHTWRRKKPGMPYTLLLLLMIYFVTVFSPYSQYFLQLTESISRIILEKPNVINSWYVPSILQCQRVHNPFKSPVVNVLSYLTFSNSTFCPRSVCMCFMWISEQKAVISLYNINNWFLLTRSIVFTFRYKLSSCTVEVEPSALQCFKWSDFIFIQCTIQIFRDWRCKNRKTHHKAYRPPSPSK